jgi:ubiquitin
MPVNSDNEDSKCGLNVNDEAGMDEAGRCV